MDNERQQKALLIAATSNIVRKGDETWLVPSQSSKGRYAVTGEGDTRECTCPDYELRLMPCKHIMAVQLVLFRETATETKADGTTTTTVTERRGIKVTYAPQWSAYNAAQTSERELFRHLLHDLCAGVQEPERAASKGRRPVPIREALFVAGYKVFSTVSARRFASDLRDAKEAGFVDRAWHFNTVLRAIDDKELTPILYQLVTASAAPLRAIESNFAVDSTGFGTQRLYNHYTARYGGGEQRSHDYLKLHALVGVKTNVIAAAQVTDRDSHDSPQLPILVDRGADHFDIAELTADKGYSSRDNIKDVAKRGIEPYIPFRNNAKAVTSRGRAGHAWSKLFHLYNYNRREFLSHYGQRSNAESTFSMMKRVLGETLRNKNFDAQVNELLLKVIAHNIRCLVHSMFELGIELPEMSVCTFNALSALK